MGTDNGDDEDVCIKLPDGLTTSEVKDVHGVDQFIAIEFTNGDFYVSDQLSANDTNEYGMHRVDEISNLNAEGKIKDIALSYEYSIQVNILMDDCCVYCLSI